MECGCNKTHSVLFLIHELDLLILSFVSINADVYLETVIGYNDDLQRDPLVQLRI